MIARDLMNRRFAYVTADADLDYVAQLLATSGVGAVPVVDDNLSPIGIVTRSNLEKAQVPLDPSLGDIPAFLLRNRPRTRFRSNGLALRQVMTTPAITVSSRAKLADIAKVMQDHHLKRAPVIDGHKLVGVLLRREVLSAISSGGGEANVQRPAKAILTTAQSEPVSCDVVTAEAFRALVAAHERQLDSERAERQRAMRELREQRINELAAQRLTDATWREMLSNARRGAAAGLFEQMLVRFPSQLCTDGGRAINAPDPHWPQTLRGEPADIFRRWRNELQPHGFRISAQIIDFPEGLPGDAALFLMWGRRD